MGWGLLPSSRGAPLVGTGGGRGGAQWGDCRAADPLVPAVPACRAGVATRDRRQRPTAVANGDGWQSIFPVLLYRGDNIE